MKIIAPFTAKAVMAAGRKVFAMGRPCLRGHNSMHRVCSFDEYADPGQPGPAVP